MCALDLVAGKHVVELGAGTGIFTRQLAEHGQRVTAVEPVVATRSRLATSVEAAVSSGTAKETGLPDGVADAVVAATAWHWFDAPRALREVNRLLRSDAGGLGLVWNSYDETCRGSRSSPASPIVGGRSVCPANAAASGETSSTHSPAGHRWKRPIFRTHGQRPLTVSSIACSPPARSRHYLAIAALSDQEREQVRLEVWNILAGHDLATSTTIVLPYTVVACLLSVTFYASARHASRHSCPTRRPVPLGHLRTQRGGL